MKPRGWSASTDGGSGGTGSLATWSGSARDLVARLGGHPARELCLGSGGEIDLPRWLVACALLDGRTGEARGRACIRALGAEGLDRPECLAPQDPGAIAVHLEKAGHPRPETGAALLVRLGRAVALRAPDGLGPWLDGCDELESLGGVLAGLAPGFGRAAVARFLRPLRARFAPAAELPLDESARRAAVHLGWLEPEEDAAGPAALRALRGEPAPDPVDVEAALERLGRSACRNERATRCPLGTECPARSG